MTKPAMSDQQLIAYSEQHLLHELSMFWELAEIVPRREKDSCEYVALIESFATHLRNLIEFFFFVKKGGYVRARHFFEGTVEWPTKPTADFQKLLDRANNEVSHLTVWRVSSNKAGREWYTHKIREQLEPIMKDFADKASHKKLHHKVREFLQLQPENTQKWIADNVTHANVAVSSLMGLVVLPDSGASTQTQIVHKFDLIKPEP